MAFVMCLLLPKCPFTALIDCITQMSVELNIYRARVVLHHFRHSKVKGLEKLNSFELLTFFSILLYQAGDVQTNSGPTSDHSIGFAVDTGVENICITGDLNSNMLNRYFMNKIMAICQTYTLHQLTDEPAHFAETSSSIIEL